jgi:hypothetical protein
MTCIHGLGSSFVYYVTSDVPIYNQIVKFSLLDDHKPEFDHRTLTITIKFSMHKSYVEEHLTTKGTHSLTNINFIFSYKT